MKQRPENRDILLRVKVQESITCQGYRRESQYWDFPHTLQEVVGLDKRPNKVIQKAGPEKLDIYHKESQFTLVQVAVSKVILL